MAFRLYHLAKIVGHIVAKIIKTEFVVRPVSYIRFVGFASADGPQKLVNNFKRSRRIPFLVQPFFLFFVHMGRVVNVRGLVVQATDRQSEGVIDLPHPHGVAPRKIIINGNNVHAVAGKSVKINGQSSHKRLAFSGFHLGDLPLMQNNAADKLDVKVPLAQSSL